MPFPPALAGNHKPVPLPFAPGSLNGISERMISSHHENNYTGAVKNLNRARRRSVRSSARHSPTAHLITKSSTHIRLLSNWLP